MMVFTSDDLPEPLTPVTTVSTLRGMVTLMFFRLFSRQPLNVMALFHFLLLVGTGIIISPDRYFDVRDLPSFIISLTLPWNTSSPPNRPA